jgi:hypothetical protein
MCNDLIVGDNSDTKELGGKLPRASHRERQGLKNPVRGLPPTDFIGWLLVKAIIPGTCSITRISHSF